MAEHLEQAQAEKQNLMLQLSGLQQECSTAARANQGLLEDLRRLSDTSDVSTTQPSVHIPYPHLVGLLSDASGNRGSCGSHMPH